MDTNSSDNTDRWEVVLKGYGRQPDYVLGRGTREQMRKGLRSAVHLFGCAVVLRRYTATS
jgi:hypothetical protein